MSCDRKLRSCAMPSCSGERFDLVHKFPMDDQRARNWLYSINVPELNGLPLEQLRKRYFICSKHFRRNDYKNCESRSLNQTAVPRLFLNVMKIDGNDSVDSSSQNMDVSSTSVDDRLLLLPKNENRSTHVLNSPVDLNDVEPEPDPDPEPEFSPVEQFTMKMKISPTTAATTKTVERPITTKRIQTISHNEYLQPKKTKRNVFTIQNQQPKEKQTCKYQSDSHYHNFGQQFEIQKFILNVESFLRFE